MLHKFSNGSMNEFVLALAGGIGLLAIIMPIIILRAAKPKQKDSNDNDN